MRIEIARLLGWPENRVRIKVPFLGGGYGGKLYIKLEALVTALSMIAKRPVKVALPFEEMFYTITRHPTTFRIKSAVDADGRLTARRCEVFWNGGAYADIGPRVAQKSGFTATGPYQIDNVSIDSYALYTNQPPSGALRGFGVPQLVWAYESHTDMIARALKIDPLEFRRRNLMHESGKHTTGTPLRGAKLDEVLDRVVERMSWGKPFDRGEGPVKRGRGIAIAIKAVISPTTSVAIVNVNADGSTTLYCGTIDMGQGSDTAMAQMVGEILNIPAEAVNVVPRDTDITPYDMGTLGSRSLFHMGHAVRLAAEEARDKIAAMARDLGLPEGTNYSVADLFQKKYGMQAGNIVGTGAYKPDYVPPQPGTGLTPNVTPFWMVSGVGAEVEVDTETGHVRITKLVNVCDIGKPINPKICETQISGAAMMQLGFTMFEKMQFDGGQVTNASLADYKIPGIHDLPATMMNETVEAYQWNGPFGGKGVGEVATFCVSPAIGNAIDDAVGVRLTELPLNPGSRAARAARQGEPPDRRRRMMGGEKQTPSFRGAACSLPLQGGGLGWGSADSWGSANSRFLPPATPSPTLPLSGGGSRRTCIGLLPPNSTADGHPHDHLPHHFLHPQRRGGVGGDRAAPHAARGGAQFLQPVRGAGELRAGAVRLLHTHRRRPRGVWLPLSRGLCRRHARRDDRIARRQRRTRSGAGGLHRARRVPMRLLYAGLRADGQAIAGRVP